MGKEIKSGNVFLAYANYSLLNQPKNLHNIFRTIHNNYAIKMDSSKELIENICKFSKGNNLKVIIDSVEDALPIKPGERPTYPDNPFHPKFTAGMQWHTRNAITGWRYGFLISKSALSKYYADHPEHAHLSRLELVKQIPNYFVLKQCGFLDLYHSWSNEPCTDVLGISDIKCYECAQICFQQFLNHILENKEYSEIVNINKILYYGHKLNVEYEVKYKSKSKGANTKFRQVLEYTQDLQDSFSRLLSAGEYSINDFLFSIATYDLIGFLIQDETNRQKIKLCKECANFYIQTRHIKNQQFCTDKCRLKYNNRKRIESGEHREYKRKKRKEGAKESYYG